MGVSHRSGRHAAAHCPSRWPFRELSNPGLPGVPNSFLIFAHLVLDFKGLERDPCAAPSCGDEGQCGPSTDPQVFTGVDRAQSALAEDGTNRTLSGKEVEWQDLRRRESGGEGWGPVSLGLIGSSQGSKSGNTVISAC